MQLTIKLFFLRLLTIKHIAKEQEIVFHGKHDCLCLSQLVWTLSVLVQVERNSCFDSWIKLGKKTSGKINIYSYKITKNIVWKITQLFPLPVINWWNVYNSWNSLPFISLTFSPTIWIYKLTKLPKYTIFHFHSKQQ